MSDKRRHNAMEEGRDIKLGRADERWKKFEVMTDTTLL
jgi:hypothetical protein